MPTITPCLFSYFFNPVKAFQRLGVFWVYCRSAQRRSGKKPIQHLYIKKRI